MQLNVASSSENFLVDIQGYILCPDLLLQSLLPTNLYHFEYYRENNYKNIHPSTSLLLGWTDIIPSVSDVPECPTPFLRRAILTKLGTTLVMGNFSAPRALQLLVTTEKPIMPSPIERD